MTAQERTEAYRCAGRVRTAVRTALTDVAKVVVGCSGGADSLALLQATLLESQGAVVIAAIVDHGLQPDSAAVAARASRAATDMGCQDVQVLPVTVSVDARGPEAAARDARYEALAGLAERTRVDRVLLGHTLDDQAETVLLGLARGSGTRSLAGMPPRRGVFERPLLGIRRRDVALAAAHWTLQPWHDPQNDDPRFARVRVRQAVLPQLEAQLGPGITEALARTARLARQDAEALDEWALRESEGILEADGSVRVAGLRELPRAVAARVIRDWLLRRGAPANDLGSRHIESVLALVYEYRGQGPLTIPGRVLIRRSGESLRAEPGQYHELSEERHDA